MFNYSKEKIHSEIPSEVCPKCTRFGLAVGGWEGPLRVRCSYCRLHWEGPQRKNQSGRRDPKL